MSAAIRTSALAKSTARTRRWSMWTWSWRKARSSDFSAPTEQERRPRCTCSPGSPGPPAVPFSYSATTSHRPASIRAEIGFLPDVPGFYEWMTAEQFLRFAGGLFGIRRQVLDERIGVLLDLAGLTDVKTRIGGTRVA